VVQVGARAVDAGLARARDGSAEHGDVPQHDLGVRHADLVDRLRGAGVLRRRGRRRAGGRRTPRCPDGGAVRGVGPGGRPRPAEPAVRAVRRRSEPAPGRRGRERVLLLVVEPCAARRQQAEGRRDRQRAPQPASASHRMLPALRSRADRRGDQTAQGRLFYCGAIQR
jgi:hypothetical protein